MDGEHAEFSNASGSGTVEGSEVKANPTIVGPYGVNITWEPESTHEERELAQPFIKEAMATLTDEPDALPKAIKSMTIVRV